MVRGEGELDTPATPAKQLARDVTGKRYLEGQPRASSPAAQSLEGGASKQGLSNGDNYDEDPANAGTLVMNKEDAQEYQGACPNDPDPRVRWASRNGFTSREANNDLRAILNLLQNLFIIPKDLRQEKEIDRGSFGSIFAGKLNDVPVAIKHVGNLSKGSSLSYPQVFRAMRLELSIASILKHPNIVQFHGISAYFPLEAEDDDKFYLGFVFELCSAGSLFSHIHKKGTFKDRGFQEKMVIARDIACGMSYVHEHNIVHRDLSTRNVLLTSNLQVKIADFGCARRIVGEAYDSTTISGSPAYMPPEQLQGRMLTVKVDVWALGVCMWELINEQIPWSDRNCNDRRGLAKHVAVGGGRLRPMPVSKHSPATNGAANAIMEGACQASVEKRFSMAQMYQHLARLVEDSKAEATQLAADEQRLETLLQRFYSKHNPAKLPEVADLARLYRGRQHVLDERLRSSYKVDLTNFELVPSLKSSGGPDQDRLESDENNRSSVEEAPPPSDVIAERLRLFYLHLNPTKEKVVPALLKKYQGDYKGLNEELFQKYSVDLRTPIDEIKMLLSAPISSSDVSPNSNMPTPPRAALIRGGSAPPMRESPEKSINSWEAEIEPLLTFFFLQLNASKVRDVAEVLKRFRNDSEGLNSLLRKTYGIDLTAPQEKIIQQARTRAQESRKQAEAAQLEANMRKEEATLIRQQAEAAAAQEKEVEARQRLEAVAAEARATDEKKQEEASVRKQQVRAAVSQEITNGQTLETSGKHKQLLADIKGQLRRFYIAWNVFEPVDVDKMACKYVLDHEALNALLREKFHGTDLTWTTEEIGQRYESLNFESNSHQVEILTTSLSAFYGVWDEARSLEEIKIMAQQYKDKPESLCKAQQAKYHGTDFRGSRVEWIRKKYELAEMQKQAEQDRLVLKDLTNMMRQFYASWNVTRSEDELTSLAVKYKQDTSELNKRLRDRYEGTDLSTDVAEILRIKAEKERKEQEAKETARMEEQRKAEKALETARLESEKKEQARMEQRKAQEAREAERLERERVAAGQRAEEAKKQLELMSMNKLRQQLRDFFARWNYVGKPSHDAYIHEMAFEYHDNRAELSQKLRDQFYDTDLNSPAADIAAIQHRHKQERQEAIQLMIERFKESWAGHCRVARELDAKNLALQYSDGIEDLNQFLRKQCHGMDLESNDADIRKRSEQLSDLAGKLRDFYQKLNPSKTGVAQQLAERYVDDLDALSTSLRSKYGGLDLSSSTEDISAFAQNTSTQQSKKGAVQDQEIHLSDRQHEATTAKRTDDGAACDLSMQLRNFYLKHNPDFVAHAAKVAIMYDDDIRLLNNELERKYGETLPDYHSSASTRTESMSLSSAVRRTQEIDKKLADKLAQVRARLNVMHASPSGSGHVANSSGHSSHAGNGTLAMWYSGPRETLTDRLRMFYSYWNPSKMDRAHDLVHKFGGSEDMVNQALFEKYLIDLRSPEKAIMRRAHLAAKMYAYFELVPPKYDYDAVIKQVPAMVQQYLGNEEEISSMLERNYGVGLEVVTLYAV